MTCAHQSSKSSWAHEVYGLSSLRYAGGCESGCLLDAIRRDHRFSFVINSLINAPHAIAFRRRPVVVQARSQDRAPSCVICGGVEFKRMASIPADGPARLSIVARSGHRFTQRPDTLTRTVLHRPRQLADQGGPYTLAEDSWRNVYAGELEVRRPGAPTTRASAMGRERGALDSDGRYTCGGDLVRSVSTSPAPA